MRGTQSRSRRVRWTLRQKTLAAAAAVAILALLSACSGSGATDVVTPTPEAPQQPGSGAPVPSATAAPPPTATVGPTTPALSPAAVSGFVYPIAGACLPSSDNLMPNAPRPYRAGGHEGVDFYPGLACATVGEGTPVLAVKAGVVIRADWGFVEMTAGELQERLARSRAQGYTDAEALDRFRGRQVWIDHGGGVATRYAHLGGIASGINVGVAVQAGQVVGYVGNSGTPEAVTAPEAEIHLHFEIWVGESYLGAGLPPDQVRALLKQAFAAP